MLVLLLILLGLAMGSFVNALVFRLHEQAEESNVQSPKSKTTETKDMPSLSIVHGRSMCPNCRHILAWYDLVPVLSWLSLHGKCRYCKKPISWQYPIVELATAGLFLISYIFWPSSLLTPHSSLLFIFWLIFLVGFVALAVYDLRWFLLPDRIIFPLIGLAIIWLLVRIIIFSEGPELLLGAGLGALCLAGFFYLLFQISGGKWIGGGDVKLGVLLGILSGGAAEALLIIFIASLAGSLVGLPLMLNKKLKAKSQIPFGPFLLMATVVVYLFRSILITWYRDQFLFIP